VRTIIIERLNYGSLRLHGWFFKIATAELFAYDPETRQSEPLVEEQQTAVVIS
jgi:carbonic anhydrase